MATGSKYTGDVPFNNLSSTEETKDTLRQWSKRIQAAKSIVIAGSGPTGVEIAGELGDEYASRGLKEITLIASGDLPLPPQLSQNVRRAAKAGLEKLKVKVLVNTKVTGTATEAGGQTVLELNGGKQTVKADLFIPAFGFVPNTSFVPPAMLDTSGRIKQNLYLQAEGHGNIFVVGDAGNLEERTGLNGERQIQHLVKIIDAELLGQGVEGAGEYKIDPKIMMGVSLGKTGGTGQVGTWRLWSFLIWFAKSRYLGTDYAHAFVKGERTLQVKSW